MKRGPSDFRAGSILEPLFAAGTTNIIVQALSSPPRPAGLSRVVPVLDAYAERGLLLARRHDVVCVSRAVDPDYLDFLDALGIGPQRDRIYALGGPRKRPLTRGIANSPAILDAIANRIARDTTPRLFPTKSGPSERLLAMRLGERIGREVTVLGPEPKLTVRLSRKHYMRDVAVSLGIPVARGERVSASKSAGDPVPALAAAVRRQSVRTGRAIVRGGSGSSGSTTLLARGDDPALCDVLRGFVERARVRVYLVEELLQAFASPNVQVWVDSNGIVSHQGVTDQRLDAELVHGGNTYPTHSCCREAMLAHAARFTEWLRDQGFIGIAGLDFFDGIHPETGEVTPYFAEINPRVNGATYPLALLDRLRAARNSSSAPAAFAAGNIRTDVRGFAELAERCAAPLYDHASGIGVVPYNLSSLTGGLCMAAFFAPSPAEAQEGLARATESLAVGRSSAVSAGALQGGRR